MALMKHWPLITPIFQECDIAPVLHIFSAGVQVVPFNLTSPFVQPKLKAVRPPPTPSLLVRQRSISNLRQKLAKFRAFSRELQHQHAVMYHGESNRCV